MLGVAARLLRSLIHHGELSDDEGGRLARDLSPDAWAELGPCDREPCIQAGRHVMEQIQRDTYFPLKRRGDLWVWDIDGKAVRCPNCGRVLGFATERHELRIIFPTIQAILIESGRIRCSCGEERIWRPYNPN
jgi:hypothetical protein